MLFNLNFCSLLGYGMLFYTYLMVRNYKVDFKLIEAIMISVLVATTMPVAGRRKSVIHKDPSRA